MYSSNTVLADTNRTKNQIYIYSLGLERGGTGDGDGLTCLARTNLRLANGDNEN